MGIGVCVSEVFPRAPVALHGVVCTHGCVDGVDLGLGALLLGVVPWPCCWWLG